jgi:hypothetical protein
MLANVNEDMQTLINSPGIRFQTFPLRHSFIPKFVPFDLKGASHQILCNRTRQTLEAYSNPEMFWQEHFLMSKRCFRWQGLCEFAGYFQTDGVG